MHQIHDSLLPLAVAIQDLVPDPENARRHTDRNLDAIAASLRAYGQRKPIVVQKTGMIVRAGNGTLDAAKRLGWDQIAAVLIDETDVAAMAYALADNRTAELAEWDEAQLAKLLSKVSTEWDDYDPMNLGFEEAEVIRLLAKFGRLEDTVLPTFDLPTPETGVQQQGSGAGGEATPSPLPPVPSKSQANTIQLFFTPETHTQFLGLIRALAGRYGTHNMVDTLLRALSVAEAN